MKCLKRGCKVEEVASREEARKRGKPKLPTMHGYKLICCLLREIITLTNVFSMIPAATGKIKQVREGRCMQRAGAWNFLPKLLSLAAAG